MRGSITRSVCAFVLAVLPLCATTVVEFGDPWGSLVTPGYYSGSRSSDSGGGLRGAGGYVSGFTLDWMITSPLAIELGGNGTGSWYYTYTLTAPRVQGGGISHAIFGLTESACSGPGADPGCVMYPIGTPVGLIDTYSATSNGNSNPFMPSPIFGVKFNASGSATTVQFYSTHEPVWGDFYAKGGAGNAVWNAGLENVLTTVSGGVITINHADTSVLSFIPRPDGSGGGPPQETPEPGAWALLGAGLVVLGLIGRRRRV